MTQTIKPIKINPNSQKVWRFDYPPMTMEQAKKEYLNIINLFLDIEKNPGDYEFNRVELIEDSDKPLDVKSIVCVLPYNAFRGYLIDIMNIFIDHYFKKGS